MLTTVLAILAALLLFLAAFLLFRTALWSSGQAEIPPAPEIEIDAAPVAVHLARLIRCQTISSLPGDPIEAGSYSAVQAFLSLRAALAEMYPRAHAELQLEVVNDFSLLYEWPGADSSLDPILLLGHQDVVPVEPGTEAEWTHPPFSGEIADGYVWGRGALDFKNSLVGIMEAVEWLLRSGFQPQRTVLIAFGHDEELGGMLGARRIAALLEERGIRLESVLDEGGLVTLGVVPGVDAPVAVVGIAEKGYLSLELRAEAAAGHSSAPGGETSIAILGGAIHRLETHPLPAQLEHIRQTLRPLAADLPFFNRLALANTWLFGGLIERMLRGNPRLNALLRTTCAATMIAGGVKDNVLCSSVRAVVNCRILPGESVASTVTAVRAAIADERVQAAPLRLDESVRQLAAAHAGRGEDLAVPAPPHPNGQPINGWEPSPVTPVDSPVYRRLEMIIHQIYPEARVAPYLMLGATDSRHYSGLTGHVFRFNPLLVPAAELETIHASNERLSVENCGRMVKFYIQWIRGSQGGERTENSER